MHLRWLKSASRIKCFGLHFSRSRLLSSGPRLSHVDAEGLPSMVDVGGKAVSKREAVARASIWLPAPVAKLFEATENASTNSATEAMTGKGPVVATAIIAGTQAVKRTADLIPFCHPLPISGCRFRVWLAPVSSSSEGGRTLEIECSVSVEGRTGVEMEALTGCSVAALTVYDMCKALSHGMVIRDVRLLRKTGGKSDLAAAAAEEEAGTKQQA